MAQTILVIDDSTSLRQIVAMALKGVDYTVLEAGDGVAALALLDGRKIGMTVCDVNMPRMNDIEFVKAAKALQPFRTSSRRPVARKPCRPCLASKAHPWWRSCAASICWVP